MQPYISITSWVFYFIYCPKEEDLEVELEKAAHYMQFAAAAYGWPLYIYSNLFTGPCKLCGDWYDTNSNISHGPWISRKSQILMFFTPLSNYACSSCKSSGADYDIIGGDNLGCHFNSILQTTGLQYRDFVYVSFHNQVWISLVISFCCS